MNFMQEALRLAIENVKNGGRPFGSVIVKNNTIIATGVNSAAQTFDPTAHAEIVAIRAASQLLRSESLEGCTVYTTCEPCPMCLGALYWAQPDKVIFAMRGTQLKTFYYATRKYHRPENFYQQFCIPFEQRTLPLVLEENELTEKLVETWKKQAQ